METAMSNRSGRIRRRNSSIGAAVKFVRGMKKRLEEENERSQEQIPTSITLRKLISTYIPGKLGVMQVMKFSGKRSATWQNQLLVLYGNALAVFPTHLEPQDIRFNSLNDTQNNTLLESELGQMQKTKSECIFDLSEPSLSVSVAVLVANQQFSSQLDQLFEWTLSVQRLKGLVLVRFRCRSKEERDSWVSALRSFESRNPFHLQGSNGSSLRKSPTVPNNNKGKKRSLLFRALSAPAKNDCEESREETNKTSKANRSWRKKSGTFVVPREAAASSPQKKKAALKDTLALLLATLESQFEAKKETYAVHSGAQEILARQQDLVKTVVRLLASQNPQILTDTPLEQLTDNALLVLQENNWDPIATVNTLLNTKADGSSTSSGDAKNCEDATLCQVCFESGAPHEMDSLACGHLFCKECWSGYIQSQVKAGKECLKTKCMSQECKVLAPHTFIQKFITEENQLLRFQRICSDAFVEKSSRVRWCPRPACGSAVELTPALDVDNAGSDVLPSNCRSVLCHCGFSFCFDCGNPAHEPASCAQLTAWEYALSCADEADKVEAAPRQEQDLALAKRWILRNSRPCPKCKAPIEKSQGCNHMVCSSCAHEFCWFCFGEWSKHGSQTGGFFRCNIFQEREEQLREIHETMKQDQLSELESLKEKAKEEKMRHAEQDAAFRRAQALRKRVSHYKWRQDVHRDSAEWARKELEIICDADSSRESMDLRQLLKRVLRIVTRCRETLQWAYVVCYFLDSPTVTGEWFFGGVEENGKGFEPSVADGPHRALFFAKVGKLEQATERLQHAVEAPAVSLNLLSQYFKPTASKNKSKAERLLTSLAPFRDDLFQLSSKALESATDLRNLAFELNHHFHVLASPPCPENNQTRQIQDRKDFIQKQETALCIVPVLPQAEWLCTLCCWKNDNKDQICEMCLTHRSTNLFRRSRSALVKQVRTCVSCSTELELPSEYQNPCSCGFKSSLSPTNLMRKGHKDKCARMLEQMEFVCPECNRNVFNTPENTADKSATDIAAEKDEEEFASVLSSELEEERFESSILDGTDVPDKDLLCPWGHPICFTPLVKAPITQCDVCTTNIEPDGLVGFCRKCNWFTCRRCSEVHGLLSKIRHAQQRPQRKRRNAVLLNSIEELRLMSFADGLNAENGGSGMGTEQPSGWSCGRCTFFNTSRTTRCSMCLSGREIADTEQVQQQEHPEEQDMQEEQEMQEEQDMQEEQPQPARLLLQRVPPPVPPPLPRAPLLRDQQQSPSEEEQPDGVDSVDAQEQLEHVADEAPSLSKSTSESSLTTQRSGDGGGWGDIRDEDIFSSSKSTLTSDAQQDAEDDEQDEEESPPVSFMSTITAAFAQANSRDNSGRSSLAEHETTDTIEGGSVQIRGTRLTDLASRGHLASTRSENQIFSPRAPYRRRNGGDGPLVLSSPTITQQFISSCSRSLLDRDARRCLTLLKPVRRDPKRVLKEPIQLQRGQVHTIEIFWETSSTRARPFNEVEIVVNFANLQGSVVSESCVVPDSGVCYVKIQDTLSLMERYAELRYEVENEGKEADEEEKEGEDLEVKKKQIKPAKTTDFDGTIRVWIDIHARVRKDDNNTNECREGKGKAFWSEVGLADQMSVSTPVFRFK